MPGLFCTVDAFSIGLNWINGDGFGFVGTIHSPRIGSIAPDYTSISDNVSLREVGEFSWDGKRLVGPHGKSMPDLDTFKNSGSSMDNPSPTTISYQKSDGTNVDFNLDWDFFGLGCPELGVDTREGIFGLISNDPLENCFIDLTPNSTLIENVGVQMILSQLLALKGGSIGFFFSNTTIE